MCAHSILPQDTLHGGGLNAISTCVNKMCTTVNSSIRFRRTLFPWLSEAMDKLGSVSSAAALK